MDFEKLQKIECNPKRLDDYAQFVPDTVESIKSLAESLKGLKVVHVSATAQGGGVAELLKCAVALQKDMGIESSWYVIPPDKAFFEVTKKIHNFLQGKEGDLSEEEKNIYLEYNKKISQMLLKIEPKPDIMVVHDPQPAVSIAFQAVDNSCRIIWRCHLDMTPPNESVWNFLIPYLARYSHYVFTLPDYVPSAFPPKDKTSFITPVIDPLSPKNILMDKDEAKLVIKKFGIDTGKPLITQISRLDPWKDPLGVIDAYRLAKKKIPDLQLALVAQNADDDPEGERMHSKVKKYIGEEKDIYLLIDLDSQTVNAFQTASDIILQKSIKESFGLTVTEAMWKGAVVIAGNTDGIRLQITDGVNGFLVNSPEETAEKIIYVLENQEIKKRISQAARQSVKERFLFPYALLDWLTLFNQIRLPST